MVCTIVDAEVKIPFAGRYGASIQYTPENQFECGFNLVANAGFAVQDQGLNMRVSVGSIWPRDDQINIPFSSTSFAVPYYLSGITLTTEEPVFSYNNSGKLTIGSLEARYSPYTVMLTGSLENPRRKGIGLENVKLGKSNFDGFLAWRTNMDKPTFGCKVTTKGTKHTLSSIYVHDFLYSPETNKYETMEKVLSFELVYPLFSGSLSLTHGLLDKDAKKTLILQAVYTKMLPNGVRLNVTYRDFEPGFRPVFSDHTGRVDRITGQARAWNPLDRYAAWKGIVVGINGSYEALTYNFTKEAYQNRDYFRDGTLRPADISSEEGSIKGNLFGLQSDLAFKHTNKAITNDNNTHLFLESNSAWGKLSHQKITEQVVLNNSFSMWQDNGVELLDENGFITGVISETGKELLVTGRLRKGIFSGITLEARLKALSNPGQQTIYYKGIGAKYSTRSGIEILWRYTTPNFEEYSKYYMMPHGTRKRYDLEAYDRYGDAVLLDNVFYISYSTRY